MHLLDVGLRMEIVRFVKMLAELAREQFTNCRFPYARDAKNNHEHEVCLRLPILSTKNAITTKIV